MCWKPDFGKVREIETALNLGGGVVTAKHLQVKEDACLFERFDVVYGLVNKNC